MVRRIATIGISLALTLLPVSASAYSFGSSSPSFLELFPREQRTCGKTGWIFTGLIRGTKPVTACVLQYRGNRGSSPFGPL